MVINFLRIEKKFIKEEYYLENFFFFGFYSKILSRLDSIDALIGYDFNAKIIFSN